MDGFKKFLLRGNLVELAVAFIMAGAFAVVVNAVVAVIMDVLGKVGGSPNFSNYTPGGVHIGTLLNAIIAFVILAAVVYFVIVTPYTRAMERSAENDAEEPAATSEDVRLLQEIRDLLAAQQRQPS